MRGLFALTLAAAALWALASGCARIPAQPLDLTEARAALESRALDVEPVRAFAARLAAQAPAAPAAFAPADGLNLLEAQAVALWYNADLRMARLHADHARAIADSAGRSPDPEVALGVGGKRVEDEPGGFLRDAGDAARSWINTASLSITVPVSGRLRLEKDLARMEISVELLRAAEAEWAMLTQVRQAWARWSAAHARGQLLGDHLQLLAQFERISGAMMQAGEVQPSTARLFAIERMRQESNRERGRADEADARVALLLLLGLLPHAPVELQPELPSSAAVTSGDAVTASHPTLLRVQREYGVAEQRLRLELRKQYPDLTFSPTFSDEEDESSVLLGLGFPLPLWNANRRGIAEARAERDLARARAESAIQTIEAEAAQARAALDGSRAQRIVLSEGAAPAVDAQVRETLALLELGEIDLLLVYEALRQALETKQELIEATLAEAIAAARVDAVSGADAAAFQTNPEGTP